MSLKVNESKLIEIFVFTDDFVKAVEKTTISASVCPRRRTPGLSLSEMMSIVVFYHYSGYKCFEYYYERCVLVDLRDDFPQAPSYTRFIQLMPRCFSLLYAMATIQVQLSTFTGIYYMDSKKLPICDNRRIHSHKVFEGLAQRGKTTTGWFFGFKIHLTINCLGEIMRFKFTPGNTMDNNKDVLDTLLKSLQGKCFGDKGYITKHVEEYLEKGVQIITRIRKNMKNSLMNWIDKALLLKRGVIESVNDILMTVFDIDHTRHRSPKHAFTHMVGAIIAYNFYDSKPTIFKAQEQH